MFKKKSVLLLIVAWLLGMPISAMANDLSCTDRSGKWQAINPLAGITEIHIEQDKCDELEIAQMMGIERDLWKAIFGIKMPVFDDGTWSNEFTFNNKANHHLNFGLELFSATNPRNKIHEIVMIKKYTTSQANVSVVGRYNIMRIAFAAIQYYDGRDAPHLTVFFDNSAKEVIYKKIGD